MTAGELKTILERIHDDAIVVIRTDDPDVLLHIKIEEKNISTKDFRTGQYTEDFSGNEGLIIAPDVQRRRW